MKPWFQIVLAAWVLWSSTRIVFKEQNGSWNVVDAYEDLKTCKDSALRLANNPIFGGAKVSALNAGATVREKSSADGPLWEHLWICLPGGTNPAR